SHLVFLHQVVDAFGVFQNDFVFSLLNIGKRQLNTRSLHTKISRVLHLFVDVGRHQHLLGRNTASQSTSAAQPVILLDDRGLQSQLPCSDGGYIPTWTTADNYHIKLFSQFSKFLPMSDTLCSTHFILWRDAQPELLDNY